MGVKVVAVLAILAGIILAVAAARAGPLVEDTSTNESDKSVSAAADEAVLRDGAIAEVSVVLINGDGEDPANVFGLITARTGDSPHEIVLFQKSSNQHVPVRPGHLIPMSNTVIPAVPSDSLITIRADLWDYDRFSPNDPIAQGSALFPAQSSGTKEQSITGKYGEIKVRVIWHGTSMITTVTGTETS